MRVLDFLHVVGGNNDGAVEQGVHLAAARAHQAHSGSALFARQLEGAKDAC